MADTPLGKGLIEIGANLAPLEAGLAQAQAKTRAALGGATVNVGGATTGAGPAAASAATATATKAAASAFSEMSNAASQAGSAVQDYGNKAAVAKQKIALADTIKNSTKGFRDLVGSITSTVGAVTGLINVGMLVVNVFWRFIESQKQAREEARKLNAQLREQGKAYTELHDQIAASDIGELFRSDFGTEDILGKELKNIDEFFSKAQDGLRAQNKAKLVSDEDYFKKSEELADRMLQEKASAEQRATQRQADKVKGIELESKMKLAKLIKDERLQAEIALQQELLKIEMQYAQGKIGTFEYEQRKEMAALDKQLTLQGIKERLDAEKQAADEIKAQKKKDADEIAQRQAEAARKAQADLIEAQRASFAGLQNQINSLFNTGNMEVGINRVASLVQVLIDKTERR